MILYISIAVFFIALVYVFEIFKDYSINKIFSLFLGVFVYYLLLYNVTYNSDWDMYESFFLGHAQSNDFLFNFISESFSARGYDYESVYKLHIVLMGFCFFYFANRNSYSNVFAIIATYLLFQLVPVSNQIRYFLAFSFFLTAVYNLIVARNRIVFLLFCILSLVSHSGIFLMYPFLYFYYFVNTASYTKKIILYSLVLAIGVYFVTLVQFIFDFHFGTYLEGDYLSSLLGGFLNNFVWLLWIIFIYLVNKRLLKSNVDLIEADVKYQFFYKLSLYSVLFLPVSLMLQILAHRYIEASLVVWLTFYFYAMQYEETLANRLKSISMLLLLIILTFLYIYILPSFLLGINATDAVFELFLSNKFFFNAL